MPYAIATPGVLPERLKLWYLAVGVASAVVLVQVVAALTTDQSAGPSTLSGSLEVLVAVLSALVMLATSAAYRRASSQVAGAWLLLGAAHLSYAAGDVFASVLGVTLASDPLSPLMNLCYLTFYPLFVLGVLRLPTAPLRPRDRGRLTFDITVVLVSTGLAMWTLMIRPLVAMSEADTAAVALTVAFPLGDVVLLWAILAVLLRREEGRGALAPRLLAASAAILILSDLAYGVQILTGRPGLGAWLTVGYSTSHLVAALAACRYLAGLRRPSLVEPTTGAVTQAGRITLSLGVATVALLVGFLAHFFTHRSSPEVFEGVAVVTLVLLIAGRQVYESRENRRLYRRLAAARDDLELRVRERTEELAVANRELRAEVGERQRAQAELSRQVDRLAALRAVDAAITGGNDLRRTLDVLAGEAVRQLGVDAVTVLILHAHSSRLEHAASAGLPRHLLPHAPVLLDGCPTGRAAIERRTVSARDLAVDAAGCHLAPRLLEHGFRSILAVPLVAKGLVRGVLEVIHRDPLDRDADWHQFLHTLAGQAAVAIENGTLLEELQRSNVELSLAYDTTLEGWSRALELRDKETEGHTRRVADLTVRLARAMGVGEDEAIHVRRGALLHDIGKVAIPDHILLKPGPLDDDEWTIMRRHPEYARTLLAPIEFLRPALAIPYGHHERWDGRGYPRGLAGEGIPLAARIFAVIDSWDALSHDRPYREAWPRDRILEHLQSQAGTQFDPEVVDAFLELILLGDEQNQL